MDRVSSLRQVVESRLFITCITGLIILNAFILGVETYPGVMAGYGPVLKLIDHTILWIFVVELILRFLTDSKGFFRSPWTIFDVCVIGIAFIPANEFISVLRAARVLRVLRLVSIFPQLRRVVEGLVRAIPGIGSIGVILALILYVFAVMATKLYGTEYPEWFGSLQASFFSLFQIMTLEGWPDIVRTVMKTNPYSWVFFVIYILFATFSILNLFIAVIVDAMQKQHSSENQEDHDALGRIEIELTRLHSKINELKQGLSR